MTAGRVWNGQNPGVLTPLCYVCIWQVTHTFHFHKLSLLPRADEWKIKQCLLAGRLKDSQLSSVTALLEKPLKPVYWHDVSGLTPLGCSSRVWTQWQRFCKAALSVLIPRIFSLFFFCRQTISTRLLSWRKAMRLHWSPAAHESVTSGVRFQAALRLPFSTLNSLLAWASERPSQSKHPETAVQTF